MENPPKRRKLEKITLNVGGSIFVTTRSTLLSRNDTMLARMFSDENTSLCEKDENGDYFIDSDPEFFKYVINYYRTGVLVIPDTFDKAQADILLGFWGIILPNHPEIDIMPTIEDKMTHLREVILCLYTEFRETKYFLPFFTKIEWTFIDGRLGVKAESIGASHGHDINLLGFFQLFRYFSGDSIRDRFINVLSDKGLKVELVRPPNHSKDCRTLKVTKWPGCDVNGGVAESCKILDMTLYYV